MYVNQSELKMTSFMIIVLMTFMSAKKNQSEMFGVERMTKMQKESITN